MEKHPNATVTSTRLTLYLQRLFFRKSAFSRYSSSPSYLKNRPWQNMCSSDTSVRLIPKEKMHNDIMGWLFVLNILIKMFKMTTAKELDA